MFKGSNDVLKYLIVPMPGENVLVIFKHRSICVPPPMFTPLPSSGGEWSTARNARPTRWSDLKNRNRANVGNMARMVVSENIIWLWKGSFTREVFYEMYVAVAPPGARTVKALLSKHRDLLHPNTQIGDENSCEQNPLTPNKLTRPLWRVEWLILMSPDSNIRSNTFETNSLIKTFIISWISNILFIY